MKTTKEILQNAKGAAHKIAILSEEERNLALYAMADALIANQDEILAANQEDVAEFGERLGEVMTDRLRLTEARILGMANGIREAATLPDPLGRVLDVTERPNGLTIKKVSVPLGVIGIIYESRPNVTSDAAALSFKSGNVCVLKSGKEAFRTSLAIISVLKGALVSLGITPDAVNILEDNSRAAADEMMGAVGLVDALIPRGGKGLIRHCVENAKVPCIETGTGICHIYIDKDADIQMALDILENAKTSRPSVCNAAEVCLIHREVAQKVLPLIKERLVTRRASEGKTPVELRLDTEASRYIDGVMASADDFDTEFLDYILAVAVVGSVNDAIDHIRRHSTGHSDAIVTENEATAELFVRSVDSSSVYVNASTRFTDGGEFGLGCEIGISTQKLHARGPMGLCELTSYKYIVRGNGQIR